jgi:hypothetical protein
MLRVRKGIRMPQAFNPDLFVASWYAGRVGPEHMPAFAADALEAGYDGPSLRRLAGLIRPTARDIGDLFEGALREIGTVPIQSKEQAFFFLSRLVARDILEGRVEPIRGADILASYAMILQYPECLVGFFGLADLPRWGEYALDPQKLAADIVAEARRFLASTPE